MYNYSFCFVVVQSLSHVWHFTTPWTVVLWAPLSSTTSWSLHRLPSIELLMLSNLLILCHPFSFAFNVSQHQGIFQWVCSLHQVAKGLELQLQHQSFQWIFRVDFLFQDWLVWSPCSARNSQGSSQHQNSRLSILPDSDASLLFKSHIHTWLLAKPKHYLYWPLSAK